MAYEPERHLEQSQRSFLQGSEDPLYVSLAYGSTTGLVCVGVGYPLDTLKVRLQLGHSLTLGLFARPYRGVLAPLLAVTPSWASNFAVYGATIKIMGGDSLPVVITAGGLAGLGYAAVVCPFEMVKCNTQHSKVPLIETFLRLQRLHGFAFLYRGWWACMCRDVGQGGAYYGFAELFGRSEWLHTTFGDNTPFVAGMLTGLGHCHVELPFDCVKTRMQTNLSYRRYNEVFRELFAGGGAITGVRVLYKGYTPWMLRAMVSHGSAFYAISKLRDLTGW